MKKVYNENDKVRGVSMYFDDDAVFKITGEQLKTLHYLSKLQGGSAAVHFQIRDILYEVVEADKRDTLVKEGKASKIIIGS